tara:strand:- start:6028 stop:10860 length:4833 start_codon:yes stop_codon:yes gene_type:complete
MITYTSFIKGRMNKAVDERLLPAGEYTDALNVRLGSTETTEIGSVENAKGNTRLTTLQYNGNDLDGAICIGAYEDGSKETIYWFVTSVSADMVVSFNTSSTLITYHVICDKLAGSDILKFDSSYLITGVSKIGNLLLWTDDLNPPRKINVTRNYPNSAITDEDINLIVKPPSSAPGLKLITQATEANYMESRMISFAYRYKYKDNEYSALSQFTDIAFVPGNFSLDAATNLNTGMLNIYNAVEVSFNTGTSNVIGVDLCFKFSSDNILNVIEQFDKTDLGWPDNATQTQVFSNSKIYTTLTESELLRLFDNVPTKAKALTIMGNRLIFGNYTDGFNLVDNTGANCLLTYTTSLLSESVNSTTINTTLTNGILYTIDPTTAVTVPNTNLSIDLTPVADKLKQGALLTISIQFIHKQFTGGIGTGTIGKQASTEILTNYSLPQDFGSVSQMVNSVSFQSTIGTSIDYFQSVANCASGTSLTDSFNCAVDANRSDTTPNITWSKKQSGITGTDQGFIVSVESTSATSFNLQIPAMLFEDIDAAGGVSANLYEYYEINANNVTFLTNSNTKSLHSNRNYEVGIVYMDEYLRSSTALVSPNNTIFVPASFSETKNQITVSIPIGQRPPFWASYYKFVVKRAEGPYETIYSNFYYQDLTNNSVFFRLEGQNQTKVQPGDILRIKIDATGTPPSYTTNEVLSTGTQAPNFLTPSASAGINPFIKELAGFYMELRPTNFSVDTDDDTVGFDSGNITARGTNGVYPRLSVPCFETTTDGSTNTYTNIAITQNTIVSFDFEFHRRETASGSAIYNYEQTFVSNQNYDSLWHFVNGMQIDFSTGISSGTSNATNVYTNTLVVGTSINPIPNIQGVNQYQFYTTDGNPPSSSNRLYLALVSGIQGANGKRSYISARLNVQFANRIVVFETIPIDIDNDIYYEDDQKYNISTDAGIQYHDSGSSVGDQGQTATLEGIVKLGSFDCFAFGNGVESFKVEDSLVGQSFTLGQRVTSVSQVDFKEADRFAGLTYSEVFNQETNINKLNVFNLGLTNFKDLEVAFGEIQILDGRETDILCLQEDKISYVLTDKDLLSTAAAGGAITSSPLVLGQQIARTDDYGISLNPESYTSYGLDKFFTDAKRGAVIQLKGTGIKEQLSVISQVGMRSYFRDLFIDNFKTQKLGGFDPYMNEYVLSSTSVNNPQPLVEFNCGVTLSKQNISIPATYTVNFNEAQGLITIIYNIGSGTANLKVNWNGSDVINSTVTGTGTETFTKNLTLPKSALVTVTPVGTVSYDITPSCPATNPLTIIQFGAGSPSDNGKFIHNQFYWKDSTSTSPVSSELMSFGSSQVSLYSVISGQASVGLFPISGATFYMQSNKIGFDTIVFDVNVDKFKYHISNVLYASTDYNTLDAIATTVVPIVNPSTGLYEVSFTYQNVTNLPYLYLIWDYKEPTSVSLRHGTSKDIACCSGPSNTYFIDTDAFQTATAIFTDSALSTKATNEFYQAVNQVREQVGGLLQTSETCNACGSAIPLCYSDVSEVEVCCTGCTYSSYNSSVLSTTRSGACGLGQTETYYLNGSGATPIVNNFVYSDNLGTSVLPGGYYSLSSTSVIFVDGTGRVINLLTC